MKFSEKSFHFIFFCSLIWNVQHVEKQENHQTDVWAMNKAEQRESAPKFKAEGGDFFKAGNYDKAGESYEKALKCIGRCNISFYTR